MASARAAGADVEAEVPHPGRQRPDRQRAAAADSLVLQRFATTRLGKDVFDLHRVRVGGRPIEVILDRVDWSIGPGARIGLVGVNGTGKTSVSAAADRRAAAGRRHDQARRDAEDRLPEPGAGRSWTATERVLDAVESSPPR